MSYNIIDVIKDLFTGKLRFVDNTISEVRYQECVNCEVFNSKLNTCTICGCYMGVKTKLKEASCPMKKW